jgi:hypothetical protein
MTRISTDKMNVVIAKEQLKAARDNLKTCFNTLKKSYEEALNKAVAGGIITYDKFSHLYKCDDLAIKIGTLGANQSMGLFMDYAIFVACNTNSKSRGTWYTLDSVVRSRNFSFVDLDIKSDDTYNKLEGLKQIMDNL